MEIQYTGDNIKDVIEFCGECIDGYWDDSSEMLAFVTPGEYKIPVKCGDWIIQFQDMFILYNGSDTATSIKQGNDNGSKQGSGSPVVQSI